MPSIQQTQDQERAQAAWKCVRAVESQKWTGEYRALVRGAGADILTNGLGQTLAFLLAKAKENKEPPHWTLYAHLSAWIANRDGKDAETKFAENKLMDWLVMQSSEVYRQTTVEVMAYLNWLKRFAEAQLPEPKDK